MIENRRKILPVLLGGDLNAYSVARSFYERYGAISHVFARYRCGATERSKFIKTHICSGIDDFIIAVPELLKFANENSAADLYLIPCSDRYVSLIESARGVLSPLYEICIPERGHFITLSDKAGFYKILLEYGIDFPDYEVFRRDEVISGEKLLRFEYPAVVKPSDSTEYWKNPFPDMQKVYFPKDSATARDIISRIFTSGYSGTVILQRRIKDARHGVLTTLSDRSGRVVRAVRGDVIMEQIGKTSYGNHAAIITRPLDEISYKAIKLLSDIGYVGIANIDLISDGSRDYVLEANLRQGRSCDYLRAAGVSLAEYFVSFAEREKIEPDLSSKISYWHYPSHKDVLKHARAEDVARAEELMRAGRAYSPYENGDDGIVRKIYAAIHSRRLSHTLKRDRKNATLTGVKK